MTSPKTCHAEFISTSDSIFLLRNKCGMAGSNVFRKETLPSGMFGAFKFKSEWKQNL